MNYSRKQRKNITANPIDSRFVFYLLWTVLLILADFSTSKAQFEFYNHPELQWEVYESEHFEVYFHQGAERTAKELLRVANDIYEPITSLYGYEPDTKIRIIVRDHDDYSNGGAYYYDNKILIWAKPLDFALRGTHNWLWNVLTHEFTHIIQLGASRKAPRWLPAFYFQWLAYEEEKRPDVLYGYPNVLASYPLPMTVIPPWYAEGCAQFQRPGMGYDHWDSHRDMIMRMRLLEGKPLTYTEMGYYGKTSLDAESVYNHGYSLVRYIAQKWGAESLKELSQRMKYPLAMTFDHAIRRVLKLSGKELYDEWIAHDTEKYQTRTEKIRQNEIRGELIEKEGFANLFPRFSPDGKHLAFTSNKGGDYFGTSSLYIYDFEMKEAESIKGGVASQLAWSPDGRFIFYDKKFLPLKNGSRYDDIAAWDREEGREIQLTKARRASHVDVSPDGKQLSFIVTVDGTQNLWTASLPDHWWEGKGDKRLATEVALTHFSSGEQIYGPRWSPDGRKIIFAHSRDRNRDISLIDVETAEMVPLLNSPADERDPCWNGGDAIFFSSDQTGIFNLYQYSLPDSTVIPVSNVLGGAFLPTVSANGKVAYCDYRATGYKLALFDSLRSADPTAMFYISDYEETLPPVTYPTNPAPEVEAKTYKPSFDKTFIYPRIFVDYGTFKPGFFFHFQDILSQMSAFGGFAINSQRDYDLFALLDYNRLPPTLFLEAFNVVRHASQTFEDPFVIVGQQGSGPAAVPIYDHYSIDYKFNLLEVDAGVRYRFFDKVSCRLAGILSRYRTTLILDDGTAFGYTYFQGKAAELTVTADLRAHGRHQDINPTAGYFIQGEIAREYNDFIEGFEVNADKGTLQEVYTPYHYTRLQLLVDRYLKSPFKKGHGITLTADLGFLDETVDDFFYLYAGGFDGMKGYSYYSLGGTRKAILRASYNIPLWIDVARNMGFVALDKIYLQGYGDIGDAWVGDFPLDLGSSNGIDILIDTFDIFKKDAGLALKMQFFSFTTFPSAVTFDVAYGFNRFQYVDYNGVHEYGKEWRYYFTLLFNFNLRHELASRLFR